MKYEDIVTVWKARLVWHTTAQYCEHWGIPKIATLRTKRESPHDLAVYADALHKGMVENQWHSLDTLTRYYVLASRLYADKEFWADRFQAVSRRKFCRMLFRRLATAGRLTHGETDLFDSRDADAALLEEYFPDGYVEDVHTPAICFTVLFAFGIVRPWSDAFRGHDRGDEEVVGQLSDFRSLVTQLRDDMPRIGSSDKPIVFEDTLHLIDRHLEDAALRTEVTPLWFATVLEDIALACRPLLLPSEMEDKERATYGLPMPGIWIDDADEGRTRFWIFPDNMLAAFCYTCLQDTEEEIHWSLLPYDMRYRAADDDDHYDWFQLIAPGGNLRASLHADRPILPHEVAAGGSERYLDEATQEVCRVELTPLARPLPDWCDWREWRRLAPGDGRYERLRGILKSIYTPENLLHTFFTNHYRALSDSLNKVAGHDRFYTYVHAFEHPEFRVMETSPGHFDYVPVFRGEDPRRPLLELEVSEEAPLYALPRRYQAPDDYETAQAIGRDPELAKLASILSEAGDRIDDVYIIPTDTPTPRLCLPNHSFSIPLDMERLSLLGIRRRIEN